MMKHNILAVIIPALLMISVANAAEIYNKNGSKLDFYGKIISEHGFTTSGKRRNIDSSHNQISFRGETKINDQIVSYGQWEYNHVKSDKDENNQDRGVTNLAFVGIKINDIGSIDYGRNYDIVHDVESYINKASILSINSSYSDKYMSNYPIGLLTYRNSNFFGLVDGLNFGIQYRGKNECFNLKQINGDGIGVSLEYNTGDGFGLIGAYSSINCATDHKDEKGGDKAEFWAIGAKYDIDNIYLATVYAETRNSSIGNNSNNTAASNSGSHVRNVAEKVQNLKLIAQYQFDCGLRPSISYVQYKEKDPNSISDRNLMKYVTTGATYFFNKNLNVYGDYRFNLLNKEEYESVSRIDFDNQATIGITYQF